LAPILHSDWLNFAVQYHYEEEVGHLITFFDLPSTFRAYHQPTKFRCQLRMDPSTTAYIK
jgi:hypothetical protein